MLTSLVLYLICALIVVVSYAANREFPSKTTTIAAVLLSIGFVVMSGFYPEYIRYYLLLALAILILPINDGR
jgi:hypothetical protein